MPPKTLVDGWTVSTAPRHVDEAIRLPWESRSLSLSSKLFNKGSNGRAATAGPTDQFQLNSTKHWTTQQSCQTRGPTETKVRAQVWGQVIGGFQDWDERRLLSAQAGEEGGGRHCLHTEVFFFALSLAARLPCTCNLQRPPEDKRRAGSCKRGQQNL